MGEIVKRHSVFLRKGCDMPAHFDLAQQPCADNWMLLEEIEAPVLDTMIRHAGWHFMYLQGSYSRSGVGLTRDNATHRALGRALKGLKMGFNAAELESVRVSTYPVFQIATVTVQTRHIQEHTSLEMTVEDHLGLYLHDN
jgi:hypothetical protein